MLELMFFVFESLIERLFGWIMRRVVFESIKLVGRVFMDIIILFFLFNLSDFMFVFGC